MDASDELSASNPTVPVTIEDTSLRELTRMLLERGNARWLDCPLDELERAEQGGARDIFAALRATSRARTLRQALAHDFLAD